LLFRPELLTGDWARDEIARVRTESQAAGDPVVTVSIYAAQDTETCPLCKHLDGMVLDMNDKDLPIFLPPLHDGCRCVAMYNAQSMREKLRSPDYERPPRELVERWLAPQRLVRSGRSGQPGQQSGTQPSETTIKFSLPVQAKVVRAEKFELVDGGGKPRAVLATDPTGQPWLGLKDQSGKNRAVLGLQSDGQPGLILYDQNGKVRAALGIDKFDKSGPPELLLYDQNGTLRVRLYVVDSGQQALVLFDQSGKNRAAMFVDKTGQPGLDLFDQNGKPRVVLNLLDSGQLGLTLLDQNGKPT
jgi:hypothetical protein